MLRHLIAICLVLLPIVVVDASFVNPYPRFQAFRDDVDPGSALYLTEYIERGDIEKVSVFVYHFRRNILNVGCSV